MLDQLTHKFLYRAMFLIGLEAAAVLLRMLSRLTAAQGSNRHEREKATEYAERGFQEVTANVVLLGMLLIRPQGLFAERMGKRV